MLNSNMAGARKKSNLATPHGQLSLLFGSRRGGARPGSGRKPKTGRDRRVGHVTRPVHARRCPVHVTLRRARLLPSIRHQRIVAEMERSLGEASGHRYRVVQYSLQADHVHLVVEATDRVALSRGMQGLAVRLARAFNRVVRRRGSVWGDRFHARELRSPREVRAGLVYVLMNHKKHAAAARMGRSRRAAKRLDPYSSAAFFDGFAPRAGPLVVSLRDALPSATIPVARPRTWLLRQGWRRGGLISPEEGPTRSS
jgi:REP element-mobilizing transposase RayT